VILLDKIQQIIYDWCKNVSFNQATIYLNCELVLEKSFCGGYVDEESREILLSSISKWDLESTIELFCSGDKLMIERFASDDSVFVSLRKVTNNRTNSILIRPTTSKWCEVEGYENGKKTKRILLPIKTVCNKLKYDFLACFGVVE
jgi:hypothetical protein